MSPLPTHIPHTPHIQTQTLYRNIRTHHMPYTTCTQPAYHTHCVYTHAHTTCVTQPDTQNTHTWHNLSTHATHLLHTQHTSYTRTPHTRHHSPTLHTTHTLYKHTCSRQTPTHITYPTHTCTHTLTHTYHTLHTCTHRTPLTHIPTPIQTHMPHTTPIHHTQIHAYDTHHPHTPHTRIVPDAHVRCPVTWCAGPGPTCSLSAQMCFLPALSFSSLQSSFRVPWPEAPVSTCQDQLHGHAPCQA